VHQHKEGKGVHESVVGVVGVSCFFGDIPFVMIALVAAETRNSSDANFSTAVKGTLSGTLTTR
jgi:hypothetical protein